VQYLWAFLLRFVWPAVKKDLVAMEAVTQKSGLDYLLVRATGLSPDEPITGTWKILTAKVKKFSMGFITVAKCVFTHSFLLVTYLTPGSRHLLWESLLTCEDAPLACQADL
jgi:hypothetical protein